MRPLFQGSFYKLSRSRQSRQVVSTPLLSALEVSDTDQTLQPTPVAHSTGLEAADHVPRRRLVGSDSRRRLQNPSLDTYDRTEDDNDIKLQPERHVDYFIPCMAGRSPPPILETCAIAKDKLRKCSSPRKCRMEILD